MSKANSSKQIRLFQIYGAKLVLEVFGGGGAIWGFSEVVCLRVPSTLWFWRPCAAFFGAIFFLRWLSQIRDHVFEEKIHLSGDVANLSKQIRLFQVSGANLVLQVFGGGGAIWGFSEVVCLRVPSTLWFWRPCAAFFGAIFFLRWLLQIRDYVVEEKIHFFAGKAVSGDDAEKVPLAAQTEAVYS